VSNLAVVDAYVRNQPEHHQKRSFEEEFATLLKKHGIEFTPEKVSARARRFAPRLEIGGARDLRMSEQRTLAHPGLNDGRPGFARADNPSVVQATLHILNLLKNDPITNH
jgi:hypothetical protein